MRSWFVGLWRTAVPDFLRNFVFKGLPSRVVFGAGAIRQLRTELETLGLQRSLILSTPRGIDLANQIEQAIGSRCAGVFPHAVMHVPLESAEAGRNEARRIDADCLIAIGG